MPSVPTDPARPGTFGIPTIGFGPGHEDVAHTTDEWISVADLVDGVRGYTALARALTGLTVEEIRSDGGELHPLASALTTTPSIGRARTRPFETRGTSDG